MEYKITTFKDHGETLMIFFEVDGKKRKVRVPKASCCMDNFEEMFTKYVRSTQEVIKNSFPKLNAIKNKKIQIKEKKVIKKDKKMGAKG